MTAERYYVAVVDFGKTNKKVLLYDRDLQVKRIERKTFEEIEIEGLRCDDLNGAMEFVYESLRRLAGEFSPIRAVSFTTHGASVLTLDGEGNLVFPPVSYDHSPPPELYEEFYKEFGDRRRLQARTMTPPFPFLINPGIGLFFLKKHDPERFERIERILFLPQYLGFLMTGRPACEPTYVGCHTYLWDFEAARPSHVAEGLGVADKMDLPLKKPWDVQGTVKKELAERLGLPSDCVVTCGIHDSNASLLPYLLKEPERDFVLNSTGTWCVAMSPRGSFPLAEEELGREIFFNLSAFGKPVKTTIFRGGAEFAFWSEKLGGGTPHPEVLDADLAAEVVERRACVLPTLYAGSGMFPKSYPSLVRADYLLEDPLRAYLALDLSLAVQSRVALLATSAGSSPTIFIEGGFRNNAPYCSLLAALMPESEVYLSNLAEATAFGAAILGVCAVEGVEPAAVAGRFAIETQPVPAVSIPDLEAYREDFVRFAQTVAGR